MTDSLTKLSIAELRRHFSDAAKSVTQEALNALQRDPRRGAQRLHAQLSQRLKREKTENLRIDGLLKLESGLWTSGIHLIAGVDEAGTGPLAGPVIAAAVVFPPYTRLPGIDDSKRLSAAQRTIAEASIRDAAVGIGIGIAEVDEIDRINIYQAALMAMHRAVQALPTPPDQLLVDARTIPDLAIPQQAFNQGDSHYFSIAAASIIAKTHRDRLMQELDELHPQYGFAQHKGYGTAAHQQALGRYGPCAIHRRSFSPVAALLSR